MQTKKLSQSSILIIIAAVVLLLFSNLGYNHAIYGQERITIEQVRIINLFSAISSIILFFLLFYVHQKKWWISVVLAITAGVFGFLSTFPFSNVPTGQILQVILNFGMSLLSALVSTLISFLLGLLILKNLSKNKNTTFLSALVFAIIAEVIRYVFYLLLSGVFASIASSWVLGFIINTTIRLVTITLVVLLINVIFKPKPLSGEVDIVYIVKNLRNIGSGCRKDHQMLLNAMADRVQNSNGNRAVILDTASDILLLAKDVFSYNQDFSGALILIAKLMQDHLQVTPSFATPKASAAPSVQGQIKHIGTRYRDEDHARTNWVANHLRTFTPVVIVRFPSLDAARKAILELSYIHEEAGSGELITDKLVEFGCYQNSEGQGEVIVCGGSLTYDLWQEAKDKLVKAGGTLYKEQEPKEKTKAKAENKADSGPVKFLRKEQNGNNTYEIYRGDSEAAATAFLKDHPVTERFYYVVVETPDGSFGRDIDGIYKE